MRANRRWGISALVVLVAAASLFGATLADEAQGATGPNIVVIMTDDQWYGSTAYMPQTTALLAAKGVAFKNYHVSNPLCCPSRSTFLTGQYSHTHGVESNGPPNGGFGAFDDSSTLATWLHGAGYHTTLIGKYLNGYGSGTSATYVPPGWEIGGPRRREPSCSTTTRSTRTARRFSMVPRPPTSRPTCSRDWPSRTSTRARVRDPSSWK
jgi:arylsulfatase A-like enzyme